MAKIEENIIQNAIPDGLKEKGLAVLGTVVTNQAMVFADKMIPTLEKKLEEFDEGCPTPEEIKKIINIRNNITQQANSISKTLDKVTKTVNKTSATVNTLVGIIKGLKIGKVAASTALKLIPLAPGAASAALTDVDELITNKTFDIEGNSKITPVKSALDGVSVPLALISFYIANFIRILNLLDVAIEKCQSEVTLTPISSTPISLTPVSDELIEISEIQNQAEESPNLSTYNGFVLEIEVVPYSPTVDRRRALGKNQSGIVMIQTELSFTPIDQVMINELKFIIDRDNLRAN
tara:strand:- start:1075 stop:1953 length:879 start_codon:yes stop_codon:yes gene_type:complete